MSLGTGSTTNPWHPAFGAARIALRAGDGTLGAARNALRAANDAFGAPRRRKRGHHSFPASSYLSDGPFSLLPQPGRLPDGNEVRLTKIRT